MIGIEITQETKDRNELRDAVGSIMTRSSYPTKWWGEERVVGGYEHRDDLHFGDGWRNVVHPTIGVGQRRGAIYYDEENEVFTYEVIDKTESEIQAEQIAASEANKQTLMKQIAEQTIVDQAQGYDDTEALDNKDLFPMWDGDGFEYTIGYKCQDFDAANVLSLYKCVQAHTSQSGWRPKDVPALFVKVAYPNEIPVFVQPTGAQDAYMMGDLVHFPTIDDPVYESLIDNNVWSPTAHPSGWQLREDL